MKKISGIVNQFGQLVTDAEDIIASSILAGRIPDEPSITNRFLQELESIINRNGQLQGIQILATTMSSLGPNTQEARVGADFLAVLNIDIPSLKISKGFLCQAKRAGSSIKINRAKSRNTSVSFHDQAVFNQLQTQVGKMLNITPDSFVCIYSAEGFAYVPAITVDGLTYQRNNNEVYAKNTRAFFGEFLMCFIGDQALGATDATGLSALAEQTGSRFALMIQVKPA